MNCFLCGGTGKHPRQQQRLTLCCPRCSGSGKEPRRDNNIYLQHGVEPPTREELLLLLKQIGRLRKLLDAYSLTRRSIEAFPDLLIDTSEGDSLLCVSVWDNCHDTGPVVDEIRLGLDDLLDFDFKKLKAERAERKKRELEEIQARQEKQERQQLRMLLEKYPDER